MAPTAPSKEAREMHHGIRRNRAAPRMVGKPAMKFRESLGRRKVNRATMKNYPQKGVLPQVTMNWMQHWRISTAKYWRNAK